MVSMEQLRERRMKEGEKLKSLQAIRRIKEKKQEIKEEIRKIQGASMRAKYGTTRERVRNIGSSFRSAFKGSTPVLKKSGIALGKGILALGQSANEYYGAPMAKAPKKRTKRKKKK